MTAVRKPLKLGCSYGVRWLPDGSAPGRIGKGKLLFYGWPGLGVLVQEDFIDPVRWTSCLARHWSPSAPGKRAC
ncbi:hypothetical protein CSZ94_24190 [Janthinobacterium sp. ROICE36]|uniref:hypothetical protein n=1 Tax=Janthinobacterium sp. ROICE36 TaxID=2048670 RepID=UPI000C7F2147|nr:hypothetical protein [Janthinobacterium sp. ROICE36]PLY39824.1 hypothetical protein CSZ94_24190 [Janthinobacterium sp. ROICE36]